MNTKFLFGMLLAVSLVFCGPSNKKPKVETQTEYDYKEGLQNFQIGCNFLNENDALKAIIYLQKAVDIEPENYRYNHWLGVGLAMNGQFDAALVSLNKALEITPESTESYNYLATIYTEMGNYDKAEEYLKKVLEDKTYPQPDFAYFNLGILKQKEGKPIEAVAAFTQCVKLNEKFYRAHFTLGNLFEEDQNYKAALYYFNKAEPGYPDDYNISFKIGKMNFKLKRYPEAKRFLSQVTILFPPPEIDNETQQMMQAMAKLGY